MLSEVQTMIIALDQELSIEIWLGNYTESFS